MKANEDKLLEKLVDDVMKNTVLETPSVDFTARVMSQVLATKTSEAYVYKPLISKPVLFLVLGGFVLLCLYIFNNAGSPTAHYLNFSNFYSYYIASLFNFSTITMYTVITATLMLLVQISFLKKHFDHRFDR